MGKASINETLVIFQLVSNMINETFLRLILCSILGNSTSQQFILCWLLTEQVDYLPCLCDSLWLKMGNISQSVSTGCGRSKVGEEDAVCKNFQDCVFPYLSTTAHLFLIFFDTYTGQSSDYRVMISLFCSPPSSRK